MNISLSSCLHIVTFCCCISLSGMETVNLHSNEQLTPEYAHELSVQEQNKKIKLDNDAIKKMQSDACLLLALQTPPSMLLPTKALPTHIIITDSICLHHECSNHQEETYQALVAHWEKQHSKARKQYFGYRCLVCGKIGSQEKKILVEHKHCPQSAKSLLGLTDTNQNIQQESFVQKVLSQIIQSNSICWHANCREARINFDSRKSLKNHWNLFHPDEIKKLTTYLCPECPYFHTHKNRVADHIMSFH